MEAKAKALAFQSAAQAQEEIAKLKYQLEVSERNVAAQQEALSVVMRLCEEGVLKIKAPFYIGVLNQIHMTCRNALTATGEMPTDGFKR